MVEFSTMLPTAFFSLLSALVDDDDDDDVISRNGGGARETPVDPGAWPGEVTGRGRFKSPPALLSLGIRSKGEADWMLLVELGLRL